MDKVYLIIIMALIMLLMGFSLARQMSLFPNAPVASKLFVQRRWLVSAIIAISLGGLFLPLLYLISDFRPNTPLAVIMLVVAIVIAYLGITLGWRPVSQAKSNHPTPEALQMHQLPSHISLDDSFQAVTISIDTRIQGWSLLKIAFKMITLGIFVLPMLIQALTALLQNFLPEYFLFIIWAVIGVPGLLILYIMFQQMLETLTTREVIEIDNRAVSVTKHLLGLKQKTQYPSDNIIKILSMPPELNSFNSQRGFWLWHPRGILRGHTFGSAVSLTDAHKILETVYKRFPQYKG